MHGIEIHENTPHRTHFPVQIGLEIILFLIPHGAVAIYDALAETLAAVIAVAGAYPAERTQRFDAVREITVNIPALFAAGRFAHRAPCTGLRHGERSQFPVFIRHLADNFHIREILGRIGTVSKRVMVEGEVIDILRPHAVHKAAHVILIRAAEIGRPRIAGEQIYEQFVRSARLCLRNLAPVRVYGGHQRSIRFVAHLITDTTL